MLILIIWWVTLISIIILIMIISIYDCKNMTSQPDFIWCHDLHSFSSAANLNKWGTERLKKTIFYSYEL